MNLLVDPTLSQLQQVQDFRDVLEDTDNELLDLEDTKRDTTAARIAVQMSADKRFEDWASGGFTQSGRVHWRQSTHKPQEQTIRTSAEKGWL